VYSDSEDAQVSLAARYRDSGVRIIKGDTRFIKDPLMSKNVMAILELGGLRPNQQHLMFLCYFFTHGNGNFIFVRQRFNQFQIMTRIFCSKYYNVYIRNRLLESFGERLNASVVVYSDSEDAQVSLAARYRDSGVRIIKGDTRFIKDPLMSKNVMAISRYLLVF
jgi:hypothetical protein